MKNAKLKIKNVLYALDEVRMFKTEDVWKVSNVTDGFIALTSVLVISAVVLSIGISVSMLAIGQGQAGLALAKGEESWQFVDGCAEDALLKLRASASYAGGTIIRPEGTCSVGVSAVSTTYTLTVTSTATDYRRSVQIVAVRSGSLTITSWKEI